MMSDAEYENRRNQRAGRPFVEPIYTVEDAMRTMAYVHTCDYDHEIGLCEGVTATFTDAGHLLAKAGMITLPPRPKVRSMTFANSEV